MISKQDVNKFLKAAVQNTALQENRTYALTGSGLCAVSPIFCLRCFRINSRATSRYKERCTSYQFSINSSARINSNWVNARMAQKK